MFAPHFAFGNTASMIYYIFCVSLACVFRIICLFFNFSFFLRPSGDSKLLEEVVVPLAKTLGRMFGLSPTRHKTLSSFSHTGSVTYCGFFFLHVSPTIHVGCYVMLMISAVSRFSFQVHNNPRTGNFGALVKIFLARTKELKISTECQE